MVASVRSGDRPGRIGAEEGGLRGMATGHQTGVAVGDEAGGSG